MEEAKFKGYPRQVFRIFGPQKGSGTPTPLFPDLEKFFYPFFKGRKKSLPSFFKNHEKFMPPLFNLEKRTSGLMGGVSPKKLLAPPFWNHKKSVVPFFEMQTKYMPPFSEAPEKYLFPFFLLVLNGSISTVLVCLMRNLHSNALNIKCYIDMESFL